MRHRYSKNANAHTPLAHTYREARKAYKAAGTALRKSCSSSNQSCGFPSAPRGKISFTAKSVKSMMDDFLIASAGTGTNENVLEAELGHLSAQDKTQWEGIAEKYASKPLRTFKEAFAVLAKASRGSRRGALDWRNFDLEALRSCPGLDHLQLPAWVQDAQSKREEHGRYYGGAPF